MRPLVHHLVEHFGARRVMWGSNFPVDSLMATYDHGAGAMLASLDGIDDAARTEVMGGTARPVYRLGGA